MNISGYIIEEQIGKGGMAMVYRATQASLGRSVALKIMNPLFADDPEFSERFLDEGRLLAAVEHRNIITIYDIGISDGFHFISMEYVDGGDLSDKIRKGVDPRQATMYLQTLAECLSVAHSQQIVHRDIKPANILFRPDGTLLLTDFGIAKRLTVDKGLTSTGSVLGSPHYLSPEQAQGKAVDARADIYSLGVLYFEMLTGERPFSGSSDVDIAIKHVSCEIPKLPAAFGAQAAIIDRMMRKNPDERFPSCASLQLALQELLKTGQWCGDIIDVPLPQLHPAPAAQETLEISASKSTPATLAIRAATTGDSPDGAQTIASTKPGGATMVLDNARDSKDPSPRPNPPLTADSTGPQRARRQDKILALAGFVLIVVAVAVATLVTDGRTAISDAALPAVATKAKTGPDPTQLARQRADQERRARELKIESLLASAEEALSHYRLTTPQDRSAYTYYRQVLELAPENPAAIEGIKRVADAYYHLAKRAERKWEYAKASRFVNAGLAVQPEHLALKTLRRHLAADSGTAGRKIKSTFKGVKAWFD